MDFRSMQLHFTGPGPLYYAQHLPEGTTTFDMIQAPSGHLMLPCCKYATAKERKEYPPNFETLTLHATSSVTADMLRNPWNIFQERYSGYKLRKEEIPVLYKWNKRCELEKTVSDKEVVAQFLALH